MATNEQMCPYYDQAALTAYKNMHYKFWGLYNHGRNIQTFYKHRNVSSGNLWDRLLRVSSEPSKFIECPKCKRRVAPRLIVDHDASYIIELMPPHKKKHWWKVGKPRRLRKKTKVMANRVGRGVRR